MWFKKQGIKGISEGVGLVESLANTLYMVQYSHKEAKTLSPNTTLENIMKNITTTQNTIAKNIRAGLIGNGITCRVIANSPEQVTVELKNPSPKQHEEIETFCKSHEYDAYSKYKVSAKLPHIKRVSVIARFDNEAAQLALDALTKKFSIRKLDINNLPDFFTIGGRKHNTHLALYNILNGCKDSLLPTYWQ